MLNKNNSKSKKYKLMLLKDYKRNFWAKDVCYIRTFITFIVLHIGKYKKIFFKFRKYALDISVVALLGVMGIYVFFPVMANADIKNEQKAMSDETVDLIIKAMQNETKDYGNFPIAENASARRTFRVAITAYTSDIAQTDETPCITSSGLNLCTRGTEDIIAANFLPIGTRVRIPDLYGDHVFYVQDRMNARYDRHLDIWMKDYDDAKQFGLKIAKIEVF